MGVSLWGRPASAASGPGHPDLGGVVRSRPIALEIKKAKGKPTPLQAQRIRDLRDCGAYAWVVRTVPEALEAVYWTAKGFTRPMSNEPLDLSSWLSTEPARVEAAPFAPAAVEAPAAPEPEAAEHAFNFAPLSSPYTEEHHRAVQSALGHTHEPTIQEEADRDYETQLRSEALLGHGGDAPGIELAMLEGLVTMVENMAADQRTVGDRVTLVWEMMGQYTAVLQALDLKLGKLLEMVSDEEVAEAVEEIVEVVEAPKPKRQRKRPDPRITPPTSGQVRLVEQPNALPAEEPNGTDEVPAVAFDLSS